MDTVRSPASQSRRLHSGCSSWERAASRRPPCRLCDGPDWAYCESTEIKAQTNLDSTSERSGQLTFEKRTHHARMSDCLILSGHQY